MLKAMILAAGAGTRLRPLTFEIPKPMVPVVNRPVLHHVLANCRRHGIERVMLNLNAHADCVRGYCGDGSQWGLELLYSAEPKLMGTAGAVKKVEPFLADGPFFVLSGDGLSDVDLTAMYDFHKRHGALATMATKAVESRFEYGVTLTSGGGRIKGFLEKPSWGQVFSNRVNTGIYLFEPEVLRYIPKGRVYDFGHELWPKLLRLGKRLFAYELPSYWTDVGNLSEYRRSQADALDGRVRITIPGTEMSPGVFIEDGASVSPKARLVPPCVIGRGARVADGAVIGPYTVLGERADVGRNARLAHCILWENVTVGPDAHLSNCIVGSNGTVKDSIAVYEATVLNFWSDGPPSPN